MRQKSFRKHLNPRDVNNPLDDYLKELSLEYEIDKSLLLPWGTLALNGISLGAKNYHTHHVYFLDLFPIFGRYGRGTLRLRCSQEKHLELHRILAKCLESGDFVPYEIAIKAECPASHRRNRKSLCPKNSNSPFAVFFQNKGLFESNWRYLAQIERDCITPI